MEQLPFYIPVFFCCTVLLTLLLFYKAARGAWLPLIIILLWLGLQTAVSLSGFYTVTTAMPPRFGLLLLPPTLLIVALFAIPAGRKVIDRFDIRYFTLLHVVRIPVELTLYFLFLHKTIPQAMTFEGRNFDILCGLTAPFVYYYGYIKPLITRRGILVWNIASLLLLANIVGTALIAMPFPFQRIAFSQPCIALLYFPYSWLPGFVVPAVLFAHIACIRALTKQS